MLMRWVGTSTTTLDPRFNNVSIPSATLRADRSGTEVRAMVYPAAAPHARA